ncbi:MAG: 50S ribosomal protein L13 [Candidatus Uhrbacteria bacterium]
MNKIERKVQQIDATGQAPGRLASAIAQILIGKDKTEYQAHVDLGDTVEITNVDKMIATGKKMEQKEYIRHTGYPGGIKRATMQKIWDTKGPAEVLRRTVKNMLPKNKLQKERMKRLIIK